MIHALAEALKGNIHRQNFNYLLDLFSKMITLCYLKLILEHSGREGFMPFPTISVNTNHFASPQTIFNRNHTINYSQSTFYKNQNQHTSHFDSLIMNVGVGQWLSSRKKMELVSRVQILSTSVVFTLLNCP